MQCTRSTLNCAQVAALLLLAALCAQAKSLATNQAAEEQVSAVIPSPNQDFGDSADEIYRRGSQALESEQEAGASNEASVPVYVSPFVRSERSLSAPSFDPQESSHAPLNYAPRPSASIHAPAATPQARDLKTSASYGKCGKLIKFSSLCLLFKQS